MNINKDILNLKMSIPGLGKSEEEKDIECNGLKNQSGCAPHFIPLLSLGRNNLFDWDLKEN